MWKERWEIIECWWFFSSSSHLVFNEIAIFSVNAPHMISQPTDQFLHCHFCRSLVITKKQQRHKKNGEKWLSVDDFSVLLLTVFQWSCYFQCQCATHDIAAHRPIFATLLLPPTNYYKKQHWHKKNGEKWLSVDDFSVLLLTFFSMKLLFQFQHATHDIAAHRPIFAPPLIPPTCYY